jgi:predicted dehydrogenase
MSKQSNRRNFLKASTLAGAGFWITGRDARADEPVRSKSPNEQINFASIALGNKGGGDCTHASRHGNMIAICDVDTNVLDRVGKVFPKAKQYTDYRKMFDEMGKSIDAITVATPDNTHAIISNTAMKMGKHVYCQKPLAHDISEVRDMRMLAKQYKVATQMGNQGTSNEKFREGVEVIASGMLGNVTEIHTWTNRPTGMWPQSPIIRELPPPAPVPANLKWDLWLGPAPKRDYADKYYHPNNWRGWWDFGCGAIGDMGCHITNMPFMALKLGYPSAVTADAEAPNAWTYPAWAKIEYEFPARGDMPPTKLFWYEGSKDGKLLRPPEELVAKVRKEYGKLQNKGKPVDGPGPELSAGGAITVGDKGIMYSPNDYGGDWALLPMESYADYKAPPQTLPRFRSPIGDMDEQHKVEWIQAIRGGPEALSNFGYGGMLTEFILLANVAIRENGTRLEWDGPNMKFPNAPQAEKWLHRDYREGWSA